MATGELEKRILIARDASDLAFRIGQAVQRSVIDLAIQQVAKKNADLVTTVDVEVALAELNVAEACRTAGVTQHGETRGGRSTAA